MTPEQYKSAVTVKVQKLVDIGGRRRIKRARRLWTSLCRTGQAHPLTFETMVMHTAMKHAIGGLSRACAEVSAAAQRFNENVANQKIDLSALFGQPAK